MVRAIAQALLTELRRRHHAAILAGKPAPLEQISGAVEGGSVGQLSQTMHVVEGKPL